MGYFGQSVLNCKDENIKGRTLLVINYYFSLMATYQQLHIDIGNDARMRSGVNISCLNDITNNGILFLFKQIARIAATTIFAQQRLRPLSSAIKSFLNVLPDVRNTDRWLSSLLGLRAKAPPITFP